MANIWKNIALWTTLTAVAITGGCKDAPKKESIEPETKIVSLENTLTEANRKLRIIPNELIGAEKIEKYEVPNAKYCLVHINQTHFREFDLSKHTEEFRDFAEKTYKANYNKTNIIQKNIAFILGQLKSIGGPKIFSEGCVESLSREDFQGHYNQMITYLIESGFYKNEFDNKEFEKFMHIPGASIQLAKNGYIEILPTESEALLNKAHNSKDPSIYDNPREDYVLGNIAKTDQYFATLPFGRLHDFRDNIDNWNSKHPDEKFSLVEITPKHKEDKK